MAAVLTVVALLSSPAAASGKLHARFSVSSLPTSPSFRSPAQLPPSRAN